jgi:hypothetical protein
VELDTYLVWWLLAKARSRPDGLEAVSTMGSEPLEEHQFDDVLRGLEIEVYQPGPYSDVLVIGRNGWSERIIHELLDARAGRQLRVYSQEMFLAFLISGYDPLDEPEEVARALANSHPGLAFLERVGFQWPTTEVELAGAGAIDADLLRLGFLKYKGYTVGKAGLSAAVRQRVLAEVYDEDLPEGFPPYYVNQWGPPQSARRLKKMADSIAAFCRNNKKKDNAPEHAIADWEADLRWLKSQFYDGQYRFKWPSADVW